MLKPQCPPLAYLFCFLFMKSNLCLYSGDKSFLPWLGHLLICAIETGIYSSSPLIGVPLLPQNFVLIRVVSFGERQHHMHSQYLLPKICVFSGRVSSLESILWERAYCTCISIHNQQKMYLSCFYSFHTYLKYVHWPLLNCSYPMILHSRYVAEL